MATELCEVSEPEESGNCHHCECAIDACRCVCGSCHEPLVGHAPMTTQRERMVLGAQTFDIRCWNAARAMGGAGLGSKQAIAVGS